MMTKKTAPYLFLLPMVILSFCDLYGLSGD